MKVEGAGFQNFGQQVTGEIYGSAIKIPRSALVERRLGQRHEALAVEATAPDAGPCEHKISERVGNANQKALGRMLCAFSSWSLYRAGFI